MMHAPPMWFQIAGPLAFSTAVTIALFWQPKWMHRLFTRLARSIARMAPMLALAAALFGLAQPAPVHADPDCTFLGQNYPVHYDCLQNQPWLPYGTPGNPPNTGPYPGTNCALPMNQHNMGCS